jgi:D-glycero-alpha-D-manno-heptose-7-phosphate kinase
MIIVQAPLRVSFFGGGTDFPDYYRHYGGCALSTAIDKYIFVTIKKRFDDKLRIGYTQTEMVDSIDEIHHELIREALRMTGIRQGIEITTMGDIPSAGPGAGSGLGSSSTVTVGALHAMYAHLGELILAGRLAEEACRIEIDIVGKPIGIQDQYIAAFGGLRFFEFRTDGTIVSEKIDLPAAQRRRLNENLLLFFTGVTRRATTILGEQQSNIAGRLGVLNEMKELAYTARAALRSGDLDALGVLLHESWLLKKQLASQISNPAIDELYEKARQAGALGGKITGAGGGGFLLVYCPPGTAERVRTALGHLRELPFLMAQDGSKVIFDYQRL